MDKQLLNEFAELYRQLNKCIKLDPGDDICTDEENEMFSAMNILKQSMKNAGCDSYKK